MSEISYNEHRNRRKSIQETLAHISGAEKGKKDYPKDEKLFKYERDKAGNAFVQIRFLPSRNNLPPLVPRFEHYFDNIVSDKKRTFFENCPTTVGNPCPLCDMNKQAWKSGNEDLARKRARKQQWFTNILVLKDSQTPENNGKIFVWKIGKKIHEKIMAAMKPTEEDVSAGKEPIDIFDLETGADFCIKVKNVGGFVNYDDSYFTTSKPLFKEEKEIEKVYNSIHLLDEYVAPEVFKSSTEIQKRLDYVYGKQAGSSEEEAEDEVETFKPDVKKSSSSSDSVSEASDVKDESLGDFFGEGAKKNK